VIFHENPRPRAGCPRFGAGAGAGALCGLFWGAGLSGLESAGNRTGSVPYGFHPQHLGGGALRALERAGKPASHSLAAR